VDLHGVRVLLLGHRGAVHATAPENTLAAVDRALRQGADGVEVDVRITADGVPVCHHDAGLRRSAGDARHVATTPYGQLPWMGSHRIPRLSEVVDLVSGRGRLVVELKPPSWPTGAALGSVEAVVAVLRRHRLDHVTVSSFDRPRALLVRRSGLPLSSALLGRPGVPFGVVLRRALRDGHQEVHPHVSSLLARLDLARPAALQGMSVTGWTVDRPADLVRLAAAGLSAVICDDPRAAREALVPRLAAAG
jgi:glycerophosphoryl diester phosphodiesterase